jgi:hypothetical protein
MLPMCVIASILITSACRLIPKKVIAHLWHADKWECFVLLFTGFLCVFIDGAVGLLIGGLIALLVNSSKLKVSSVISQSS